jgi:two-component system nitrate/nitrite response regulator NarL
MSTATTDLRPQAATAPATAPAPTTALLRVVIADDHPLYRQGIVRALEASGDFAVVGEAGDGATALELIRTLRPDVGLLDVRMPELDGVDVVGALALHGPDVPVVLLSAFDDEPVVTSGLEAGAAAYISKTAERDAICRQLATVAGSRGRFAPRYLTASAEPLAGGPEFYRPRLTFQEHELLMLAGTGLNKLELADRLGLEEHQARNRIACVLRKLDTDSLHGAVTRARTLGLIP